MPDGESRDTSEEPLDTGDIGSLLAPRLDDPSPVFMLNLLQFDPHGGAEEYGAYGREMVPILEAVGASIPIAGPVTETLLGEGSWDLILWVHQRSRQGFLDMVTSPEYGGVGELRTTALVRSELRVMEPLTDGAGDGGGAGAPTGVSRPLGERTRQALEARASEGPVLLHDLVELRPDGAAPYGRCARTVAALVERAGGRVVQACRVAETLIGGSDRWDLAVVAELPTRQAIIDVLCSEEYRAVEALREASVVRQDLRVLDLTARWR